MTRLQATTRCLTALAACGLGLSAQADVTLVATSADFGGKSVESLVLHNDGRVAFTTDKTRAIVARPAGTPSVLLDLEWPELAALGFEPTEIGELGFAGSELILGVGTVSGPHATVAAKPGSVRGLAAAGVMTEDGHLELVVDTKLHRSGRYGARGLLAGAETIVGGNNLPQRIIGVGDELSDGRVIIKDIGDFRVNGRGVVLVEGVVGAKKAAIAGNVLLMATKDSVTPVASQGERATRDGELFTREFRAMELADNGSVAFVAGVRPPGAFEQRLRGTPALFQRFRGSRTEVLRDGDNVPDLGVVSLGERPVVRPTHDGRIGVELHTETGRAIALASPGWVEPIFTTQTSLGGGETLVMDSSSPPVWKVTPSGRILLRAATNSVSHAAGVLLHYDRKRGVREILRAGDELAGSTIARIGEIDINDSGLVAASLTLGDGRRAVVTWSPARSVDFNRDGVEDQRDFFAFIRSLHDHIEGNADFNRDGVENELDFTEFTHEYAAVVVD